MFKTILVPHDGSKYSENAVKMAADLAKEEKDSKVIILQVLPAPFPAAGVPLAGDIVTPDSTAELDKARKIVGNVKNAEFHILRGNPADVILQAVIDLGADLVVMGSRGMTGFSGLLLGSVSNKVAQLSKAPVLLAK